MWILLTPLPQKGFINLILSYPKPSELFNTTQSKPIQTLVCSALVCHSKLHATVETSHTNALSSTARFTFRSAEGCDYPPGMTLQHTEEWITFTLVKSCKNYRKYDLIIWIHTADINYEHASSQIITCRISNRTSRYEIILCLSFSFIRGCSTAQQPRLNDC